MKSILFSLTLLFLLSVVCVADEDYLNLSDDPIGNITISTAKLGIYGTNELTLGPHPLSGNVTFHVPPHDEAYDFKMIPDPREHAWKIGENFIVTVDGILFGSRPIEVEVVDVYYDFARVKYTYENKNYDEWISVGLLKKWIR